MLNSPSATGGRYFVLFTSVRIWPRKTSIKQILAISAYVGRYGKQTNILQCLTLWLQRFFQYPSLSTELNFLQNLHLARTFFSMFTVQHRLFSLVLMFSGTRIKAPPHPQYGVSVYTHFLKQRTNRFSFHTYVLNLVKIYKILFLSKGRSPGVDLLAVELPYILTSKSRNFG